MQTILIIGATSSIAQACMHVWARKENVSKIICVARNENKLSLFCDDFKVRFPLIDLQQHIVDFADIDQITHCIQDCFSEGLIDQALIVQGMMFVSEQNLVADEIQKLLQINTTSIAISIDSIYKQMCLQAHGKIGVIGSVAGDRGRKANYLYGASKSFVATYVEGIQHKIALNKESITISLIKPGPTASAMTQHLVAEGKKMAKVEDVASDIVQGIERGKRVIYTPKIWQYIMFVIRHLPFLLFKKLDI